MTTSSLSQFLSHRPELQPILSTIEAAHTTLEDTLRNEGRIYLCGNGGSAADCEHWAGELLKGFYSRRPVLSHHGRRLPAQLRGLQGALPAIPLTGFLSLRTAVANDIDPKLEFAQLVWGLGRPGDTLVAISTSGNAENVCLAARAARLKGMRVIGLTGAKGGKLRRLCNPCIRVPADQTHLIQELHLSVYHALCLTLEEAFFPTT
jgi:D-sedoheptulose 7-phosphate isomerase